MKFELHVTVAPTVDVVTFLRWCYQLHAKPLLIELDRGKHRLQPMIAVSTEFGGNDIAANVARESAYKWAREWEDRIRFFEIVRSKLECEYSDRFACSYYEIHWKAYGTLPSLFPQQFLIGRSQNLITGNYYLTHRHKNYGEAIPNLKYENHRECVLYDTNPKLDKGWFD